MNKVFRGLNAVYFGNSPIFRRNMSLSSESKSRASKEQAQSGDELSLAYSSTMKMDLTCLFETPVDFQWTIRRDILEDRTVLNFKL
jgi:hypothetical protein